MIEQLQQRFVGLWRRLTETIDNQAEADFVAQYLAGLKERAYLERTIANQYRGRYLFELIQNAVDNMHKQAEFVNAKAKKSQSRAKVKSSEGPPYRCHIELTPAALYVANDGLSFEEEDVRGVCAMGQSTKPAGEYIGYKGLGFRAVLEISDAPEIYSGIYEFGFSRVETLALLAGPGAPSNLEAAEVPVLSVPHPRSISDPALPESEREVLARLKKAKYATIVRLPLKAGYPFREVREACQQLFSDQTLLFLSNISELSLVLPEEAGVNALATITKSNRSLTMPPGSLQEMVQVSQLTFSRSEISRKSGPKKTAIALAEKEAVQTDWLLVEARQPLPIEPPELVARLEDPTWREVRQVKMAVAFPLSRMPWGGVFPKRRAEPLPFFAHFPTEEGSGLGFAVQADFYLSASRKQIDWETPYNQWLTEKLVAFSTGPALDAAHYLYPDEAALVEILVDYSFYNGNFGRAFRQMLDRRLSQTAFVPVGNDYYMPPGRVVWTPPGQEGVLLFRRVFRYPGPDFYYPVLQLEEVYASTPPEASSGSNRSESLERDSYREAYSSREYNSTSDYDRDPYSDKSDYEADNYSDQPKSQLPVLEEAAFDYKRIRQFLGSLGVKKLEPAQLSTIFGQALQAWDDGLISTGEICATLALWYATLIKEGKEGEPRQLIEQAQSLPVLPTVEAGWQAPENRQFIFSEVAPEPVPTFSEDGYTSTAPVQAGLELTYIRPEAYDLEEFSYLIQEWHRALGVRPAR